MITRRAFIRQASIATGAVAALTDDWSATVGAAAAATADRNAETLAGDEDYWRNVQQAFTLDRR